MHQHSQSRTSFFGGYFLLFEMMTARRFAVFIATVLLAVLGTADGWPLNSKAAGWMNNDSDEESRSYVHLGGGSKFSKSAAFSSQPPRTVYRSAGGNSSNRTLAAILLLTVFGIGATAFFVVLCSKITKKEQYDSVKGTVY